MPMEKNIVLKSSRSRQEENKRKASCQSLSEERKNVIRSYKPSQSVDFDNTEMIANVVYKKQKGY